MNKVEADKKTYILYGVVLLLVCSFLVYIFLYDKSNNTRQPHSSYTISEWTDYSSKTTLKRSVIAGKLHIDANTGSILSFYSIHQDSQVYVNGALVYQYPIKNNNPFSKSPGYSWNFVNLPAGTNSIEIIISSPYQSYLKNIPEFYIGTNFATYSYIVSSNLFQFLLCVIIFVIGAILITYHMLISKKVNANGKLLKLGVFAIFLSIWSINECRLTILIMRNNLVTSYLSFLSLMMIPIPFALFVKAFYNDDSPIWDYFCRINMVQIILSILLMVLDVADFKDTLWMTHTVMISLAAIILYKSCQLLKDGINSHIVKVHIVCILICVFALVADVIGYYVGNWDSNSFGRIGFLIYIIILGVSSTTESASLMKLGEKANAFQTLAYTDQMTGLNNRTCFNVDFEKLSKNPEDIAVIDFDLNNLKYTNDNFGHSAGDKYIKNCARIISEIFCGIGKCYRVGGDEFIALIENSSEKDLTYYLAMLESSVDASNRLKENKDLRMQIAYGCAIYCAQTDKNLEDTYNRADKIMYSDKEFKKKYSYK